MRTLAPVLCVALAACDFHPADPFTSPDGQQGSEMNVPPPDGMMQMPDGPQLCYGAGLGRVCLAAAPTQARMLDGMIDTGNNANCDEVLDVGGTSSCVIAGTTVTVATTARVRAIGSRPLVIVSAGMFLLEGDINVSSVRGGSAGAGASQPSALCGNPSTAENDSGGAGGGAGGSFAGKGGDGGNGDDNNSGLPIGDGAGGDAAAAVAMLTKLRAGCAGATGGHSGNAQNSGAGAAGGGAVYLISGMRIEISGRVIASGSGGGGADEQSGGGGGGSGGMIGLDAPTVAVSGRVTANGGGGGEGGGLDAPRADDGEDGTVDTVRAAGGIAMVGDGGEKDGGNGGPGSGGMTLTGGGGLGDNGGGGGGGGGAGFIYVKGILQNSGIVSPTATVTP